MSKEDIAKMSTTEKIALMTDLLEEQERKRNEQFINQYLNREV